MMLNQLKFMKQQHQQSYVEPKVVEVYFLFTRIGEIDTMNEKFNAEVHIESRWLENEPIDVYDAKKHWNPKLYIENALQLSKEEITYKVTKVPHDDRVFITEMRKVKGFFWERLELEHFPLDTQELSVILASGCDPCEIKLITDKQHMSHIDLEAKHTFTDQQKWRLFKLVKISELASYDMGSTSTLNDSSSTPKQGGGGEQSTLRLERGGKNHHHHQTAKIVATCFSARRPGYYIFNAYFLIMLITASSLTIFSINPKLPQNRLQTSYTLLLTSVSFKWVINRYLPTISYLTSLDKYAIVSIGYLCMLCIWHAVVGSFWSPQYALWLDLWLLITFSVILIGINCWVIVWFIWAYRRVNQLKCEETEFVKKLHSFYERLTL